MDKNLLGEAIAKSSKRKRKPQSIPKTIYFSNLKHKEHIQYNALGEPIENTTGKILDNAFYENENKFEYKNHEYSIKIHSKNPGEYLFGSIEIIKDFTDIIGLPYDKVKKERLDPKTQSIILFAFFYINIVDRKMAYLPSSNIRNVNETISKFVEHKTGKSIVITNHAIEDIKPRIEQCNKIKELRLLLISHEAHRVYAGIKHTMHWDYGEHEAVTIEIKVKKPTKKRVVDFLDNPHKLNYFEKAFLTTEDQYFRENIIDIYKSIFSVKTDINISELDLENFDSIKNKLITEYNKIFT